jgi:hypothetical protein
MNAGTSHQDLLRRRRLAALVREDARALPPTPGAGDYSALLGYAAETVAYVDGGALRRTARQWPLALDDPMAAAYVHGLPVGCLPPSDGVLPPCSTAPRRGAPPPETMPGPRPAAIPVERRRQFCHIRMMMQECP